MFPRWDTQYAGKAARETQMIYLVRGGRSAADASDDWRVGVACAAVSESRGSESRAPEE